MIHTYAHEKDEVPKTLEIDKETGEARSILMKESKISFKQMNRNIYHGFFETFLPSGYPNTVAPGYLKFTIYSNLSALTITTMSFLSA